MVWYSTILSLTKPLIITHFCFQLACDSNFDCEGKQICKNITETIVTCECEHGYYWDGSECVGECFFTSSKTLMVLQILFGSKFW